MASSSSAATPPMILTFAGQKNLPLLFSKVTSHAFTSTPPRFFGDELKDRTNIQIGDDQVPNRDFLNTKLWTAIRESAEKPVTDWESPISASTQGTKLPSDLMVQVPFMSFVVAWFVNQIGIREDICKKTSLYPLDVEKLAELDICEWMGVDPGPIERFGLPELTAAQRQLTIPRLIAIFHDAFFILRKPEKQEVSRDIWVHARHPVLYDLLKIKSGDVGQFMELYKSEKIFSINGEAYLRIDFKFFVTKCIEFFIRGKMVCYFLNKDDFY